MMPITEAAVSRPLYEKTSIKTFLKRKYFPVYTGAIDIYYTRTRAGMQERDAFRGFSASEDRKKGKRRSVKCAESSPGKREYPARSGLPWQPAFAVLAGPRFAVLKKAENCDILYKLK